MKKHSLSIALAFFFISLCVAFISCEKKSEEPDSTLKAGDKCYYVKITKN